MKIMVTGAGGFVGTHLGAALRRRLPEAELVGLATRARKTAFGDLKALDVTDANAVVDCLTAEKPDCIVHLAGVAAPKLANEDPNRTWNTHLFGSLNIARALQAYLPDTLMVHVSSGLVYGSTAASGAPLTEESLLAPTDEYSTSKAAADLALGALSGRGLRVVRMRPFNHTGPGQAPDFVIPDWANQIAQIEAGQREAIMRVGNLEAARDFCDVRDVADAYVSVIENQDAIQSGEIFNLASGTPRRVGDMLDKLLSLSEVEIELQQDPARMRPADLPSIAGDASLARQRLAWSPKYSLEDTIRAVLEDRRAYTSKA